MDWYEEPINPECPKREPFTERFAREQAAKIMDTARAEAMAEMVLRSVNGTLTDAHVDFYTQRFMRKD